MVKKMTNKQLCGDCKHLEHDGFAGIWCGVGGNNRNYDCPKYEKKERITNDFNNSENEKHDEIDGYIDDLENEIIRLTQENTRLKIENMKLKELIEDINPEYYEEMEHSNL